MDNPSDEASGGDVLRVVGDVMDRTCLIVDDIIDTGATVSQAAAALRRAGAADVAACATHAVLSGDALERLARAALTEIIVTDSIPLSEGARAANLFKVISIGRVIAETIRRIHFSDSVSSIFLSARPPRNRPVIAGPGLNA